MNAVMGAQPRCKLARDRVNHPIGDEPGQWGIFDQRNEFQRLDNARPAPPSDQCLSPDTAAILKRDDGQILKKQIAAIQSGPDICHCAHAVRSSLLTIRKFQKLREVRSDALRSAQAQPEQVNSLATRPRALSILLIFLSLGLAKSTRAS
jgi:hypothetical protein